jgi:hypothetical protein
MKLPHAATLFAADEIAKLLVACRPFNVGYTANFPIRHQRQENINRLKADREAISRIENMQYSFC